MFNWIHDISLNVDFGGKSLFELQIELEIISWFQNWNMNVFLPPIIHQGMLVSKEYVLFGISASSQSQINTHIFHLFLSLISLGFFFLNLAIHTSFSP